MHETDLKAGPGLSPCEPIQSNGPAGRRGWYGRWIERWEAKLTLRDPHRRVFPFDWGLEWLNGVQASSGPPLKQVLQWSSWALRESAHFYRAEAPEGVERCGTSLAFETPTPTPYQENNRVRCRLWEHPAAQAAVIVIPQWNADGDSHVGLCRLFCRLGLTAVRVTLPYHEDRTPSGMKRADYMVSPNIGRTLHANRQAVLEVIQLAAWLKREGYRKVGIVGTSLGSCVGYLAFTHESSIDVGVFNHVSAYFADVVWTGLSTRYVRWGLDGHIALEELRDCWAPLSPWYYIERLRRDSRRHLMITARFDPTFRPELSEIVFRRYRELKLECSRVVLPCGHYTTAHFPFNLLDGWHIGRFLWKYLR